MVNLDDSIASAGLRCEAATKALIKTVTKALRKMGENNPKTFPFPYKHYEKRGEVILTYYIVCDDTVV